MTHTCVVTCARRENNFLWWPFDFGFVKTTSAGGERAQKSAATLVAVDADLFFVKFVPMLGKETTDYSFSGLINSSRDSYTNTFG